MPLVGDERAAHIHLDAFAFAFEEPREEMTACEPNADAIVLREVLERRGAEMSGEIAGRARDDATALGDRHRDHVAFEARLGANAGIEAFGDDVHQPEADGDLDLNLGMPRREAGQQLREERACRRRRHREAQSDA